MGVVGLIVGLAKGTTFSNFGATVATDIAKNPLLAAIVATAFAYEGWITATSINSEIKNSKRNLPIALVGGTIYKQAVLEGIAATRADTETILDGGKINNMTPLDVQKIVNLKHAWEFILNKYVITSKFGFNIICEINRLVEEGFYYNAGKVRSVPVSIGGSTYKPPLPIESVVREEIDEILTSGMPDDDKAVLLMLYLMKKQIFIDGNKRTAVIAANHLLISHGFGIIAIPEDKVGEYKKLLIDYYEGKDEQRIIGFIKKFCIDKL